MPSQLQQIERDMALASASTPTTVVERMCRVSLAKDWPTAQQPRAIELPWLRDRLSRKTLIVLRPGQSVEQPLDKCHAWFGPFDLFAEYRRVVERGEEKVAGMLREHIATETARYLNRYDYPRGNGRGYNPDMRPVGQHRSPDVTIQVLDPEGNHGDPIRLYEVYGIGPFDDLRDTFERHETEDEIKARYESKLEAQAQEFIERDRKREMQLAKLGGLVEGLVVSGTVAAKDS